MNNPEELKYSKTHEWVKEEDGLYVIGLTDFAQSELGDIVFINLPEVGDAVTAGAAFADVESVKAVSDVFSPVSGTPYEAWLIKVQDVDAFEELLDSAAYTEFCAQEG